MVVSSQSWPTLSMDTDLHGRQGAVGNTVWCGLRISSATDRGGSRNAFASPESTLRAWWWGDAHWIQWLPQPSPMWKIAVTYAIACDQQEVPVGYAPDDVTITILKKRAKAMATCSLLRGTCY